jgi:hypothetical protein
MIHPRGRNSRLMHSSANADLNEPFVGSARHNVLGFGRIRPLVQGEQLYNAMIERDSSLWPDVPAHCESSIVFSTKIVDPRLCQRQN